MRRIVGGIFIGAIVACTLFGVVYGMAFLGRKAREGARQPEVTAINGVLASEIVAAGVVEKATTVEVTAPCAGTVASIACKEGRPVKAGDVLLTVDSDFENRRLALAEQELQKSKDRFAQISKRIRSQQQSSAQSVSRFPETPGYTQKALASVQKRGSAGGGKRNSPGRNAVRRTAPTGAGSTGRQSEALPPVIAMNDVSELQAAEADLRDKQIEVYRAKNRLALLKIVAPCDGIILHCHEVVGGFIAPSASKSDRGKVVATIHPQDDIYARVYIAGAHELWMPTGLVASVSWGGPASRITATGTVTRVAKRVGNESSGEGHDVWIKVFPPDRAIPMPGTVLEARVSNPHRDCALLVPSECVVKQGGDYFAFVRATNQIWEKRSVVVGFSDRRYSEVLQGIEKGAQIRARR